MIPWIGNSSLTHSFLTNENPRSTSNTCWVLLNVNYVIFLECHKRRTTRTWLYRIHQKKFSATKKCQSYQTISCIYFKLYRQNLKANCQYFSNIIIMVQRLIYIFLKKNCCTHILIRVRCQLLSVYACKQNFQYWVIILYYYFYNYVSR